jgi:hypothetical protein
MRTGLHGGRGFALRRQTALQLHRSSAALRSSSGRLWKQFSLGKVSNSESAADGDKEKPGRETRRASSKEQGWSLEQN